MSLDEVRLAIVSLDGWPGRIGCMGGEPAMHPKFREVLEIYRELIPDRRRREFWTTGWKWYRYLDDIQRTFDNDLCHVNDHTQETGRHQPLLVAIQEVVPDAALREELIEDCWVQRQWSASITPRGAFFCEVAASLDHLFDGPGGWPVEKGWWKRIPVDYAEQREFACNRCSAAIPTVSREGVQLFGPESDARGGRDPSIDTVSRGNLEALKAVGSPKIARGHYKVFEDTITREDLDKENWAPSKFRDFVAHSPEDIKLELDKKSA